MTTPSPHEATIREIVTLLATEAGDAPIGVRNSAAFLLIHRYTKTIPHAVAVRAAAYSRAALHQIGSAILPVTIGEVAHLREQVGDGIMLFGYDRSHVVWIVCDLLVDVADARDWNDHGALLRPYVTRAPIDPDGAWIVEGLRYGVCVTYEAIHPQLVAIAPSLEARRLARRIDERLRDARRLRRAS